jgi:hypothetical protein
VYQYSGCIQPECQVERVVQNECPFIYALTMSLHDVRRRHRIASYLPCMERTNRCLAGMTHWWPAISMRPEVRCLECWWFIRSLGLLLSKWAEMRTMIPLTDTVAVEGWYLTTCPTHGDHFSCTARPHLSSFNSWFIHQSSDSNQQRRLVV